MRLRDSTHVHYGQPYEQPCCGGSRMVVFERHWGLFSWTGRPSALEIPQDTSAFLASRNHLEKHCTPDRSEAAEWAFEHFTHKKWRVSSPRGDVDPRVLTREIGQALLEDRDIVLRSRLNPREDWLLVVVSSPLCLAPTRCRRAYIPAGDD